MRTALADGSNLPHLFPKSAIAREDAKRLAALDPVFTKANVLNRPAPIRIRGVDGSIRPLHNRRILVGEPVSEKRPFYYR